MFCRIRRKIKQSDGRNQVKRKLLSCSRLLVAAKCKRGSLRRRESFVAVELKNADDEPRVR